MAKATWHKVALAESGHFEVVAGNVYLPLASLNDAYFKKSATHTHCPWRGAASYYGIDVPRKTHPDAAWYSPQAKTSKAMSPFARGLR